MKLHLVCWTSHWLSASSVHDNHGCRECRCHGSGKYFSVGMVTVVLCKNGLANEVLTGTACSSHIHELMQRCMCTIILIFVIVSLCVQAGTYTQPMICFAIVSLCTVLNLAIADGNDALILYYITVVSLPGSLTSGKMDPVAIFEREQLGWQSTDTCTYMSMVRKFVFGWDWVTLALVYKYRCYSVLTSPSCSVQYSSAAYLQS